MRSVVLVLVTFLSCLTLNAQPQRGGNMGGQIRPGGAVGGQMRPGGGMPIRLDMSPNSDAVLKMYITLMAKHLRLNAKETKQFTAVYTEYYDEIQNLPLVVFDDSGKVTDEELEQQIFMSFNNTDFTTAIKRKYYPEFRKVLSVRQILMMYDVEREFYGRITLENSRRKGND
ncbi:MAG: hypothetical protein R3Y26_07040 [Rikenellaceae bacterium]